MRWRLLTTTCGAVVAVSLIAIGWRRLAPRSAAALTEARPVAPVPAAPVPALAESLRSIEKWHEEHYRPSYEALKPGIAASQLEAALGSRRASAQLRELYQWHDGMLDGERSELVPGFRFVPIAEAMSATAAVAAATASNPQYWDPTWIPFLSLASTSPVHEVETQHGIVYLFEKDSAVTAAFADIPTRMAEHAEAFARAGYYVDDEGQFTTNDVVRDEIAARFGHPRETAPDAAWKDAGVVDGKRVERRTGRILGKDGMIEERRFDERGHEIEGLLSSPEHGFRSETVTRFDADGRRTDRRIEASVRSTTDDKRVSVRSVTWTYAPPDRVTIRRRWPLMTETIEAKRRTDGSLCVLTSSMTK